MEFNNTFKQIEHEAGQHRSRREPYLEQIKQLRGGRAVVSFFISFYSHIPLMQEDADMIEEVLCNEDTSQGLTLILDAPGGDGLAAERIIQICRSYSGSDFETIVPARAKSAATMVCLGADRILMSPTSELGPIDPQVPFDFGNGTRWTAAHHIIRTYDDLMEQASRQVQGRIEPYLQQLSSFNAVYISQLKEAAALSEHIAVSSLKRGMLAACDDEEIKARIKPFTDPTITMSHGRGITSEQARSCGLEIEDIDLNHELWKAVWGLYLRSIHVVNNSAVPGFKLIETLSSSYHAG